ncbi:MAG: hypothetical protein COB20_12515 [SAR86 cluster bacterium]|uniref:Lipocalin-like domain-containing protein n=1 Tax=SAR86 cluster bacterium TaxID=2030880 RepID=A0A2A4X0K5_9GAMM|nr:MAG: hypothetical protein COB20_12515 [SAR86 cluster bacterium]
MNAEKYIGHWQLLPELCIYQNGDSPVSGSYVIRSKDGTIEFEVEWTDTSGADHRLSFGGSLDGQKHASDAPGISDVAYEKINDLTLDSTAFNGDTILMYARRIASSDGGLLAVSQSLYGENGDLTNFQVYRRKGV